MDFRVRACELSPASTAVVPADDRRTQGPPFGFVKTAVDTVSSLPLAGLGSADEETEGALFGLFSHRGGDGSSSRGSSEAFTPPPQRSKSSPPKRSRSMTTASKPTDRDLVDRARRGDASAFGDLVRRHQQRIHRLAVHMLRDRAEAEDVAQEAFIRAYQALARFDGRSEPYTWLYRITINLSLNRIRARKTARTTHDADDPRLDGLLAERGDPGGAAQRRQLYVALCEGIDRLSETLRTTLILVCIDGRSHEDASAILDAPEGTVAWRVHEARRKLKEFLHTQGFDADGDGT